MNQTMPAAKTPEIDAMKPGSRQVERREWFDAFFKRLPGTAKMSSKLAGTAIAPGERRPTRQDRRKLARALSVGAFKKEMAERRAAAKVK